MAPVTRFSAWARAAIAGRGSGGRPDCRRCWSCQKASCHCWARGSLGGMPHRPSAAGHRPKRNTTRAASFTAWVPTWAPLDAAVADADRRHPARIAGGFSWAACVHIVGVAGASPARGRRTRRPRATADRIGDRSRDSLPPASRERCRSRCPSRRDRRGPGFGPRDRSRPCRASNRRRSRSPWCAGDAGANQIALAGRGLRIVRSRQIGCFSSLSRISGVRTDTV